MSTVEQFKEAIRAAGLQPPEVIEIGKLHRFSTNGKRTDDAGWCKLFPDGQGGVFGDHRSGLTKSWQARRDRPLSPAERDAFIKQCAEAKERTKAEEKQRHAEAAEKATEIWKSAAPAEDHAYLRAKGVKSHGLRQQEGVLVVPMRDAGGTLRSLQYITADGEKRYLPGGAVGGHYHAIGKPDGAVIVCEGYATGASIHEAIGHAVAVAFDAGNLEPVARALRAKYSELKIIIAADNDVRADGPNTGIEAANRAAKAVCGFVAIPELDGGKCDFNDLAIQRGAEAVRQAIEGANAPDASNYRDGVRLIHASDLTPEPIRWLWDGRLARGKLQIVAGAPGTGKTTLALKLAATITTSGHWPDGTRCTSPGNVLIWSGEDDPTDTLLPRLLAMDADPKRIFFVGDVYTAGEVHAFDPARDLPDLMAKATEIGDLRLMICDPIVNAVLGDSHKNTEVRRALQPLVALATKLDAVVLGISHFSKGSAGRDPVERVTGSIAFGALPRVVFAAAKITDDDGQERRIFVRAKSNIGEDSGGFNYTLEQTQVPGHAGLFASAVLWGEQITGSARELLAQADADGEHGGAIAEAGDWLRDVLGHGPIPAKEVKQLSEKQGMAWRTVQLARTRIGAKTQREGFGKGSTVVWGLPIDAGNPIDANPERPAPMGKSCAYGDKAADAEDFS